MIVFKFYFIIACRINVALYSCSRETIQSYLLLYISFAWFNLHISAYNLYFTLQIHSCTLDWFETVTRSKVRAHHGPSPSGIYLGGSPPPLFLSALWPYPSPVLTLFSGFPSDVTLILSLCASTLICFSLSATWSPFTLLLSSLAYFSLPRNSMIFCAFR